MKHYRLGECIHFTGIQNKVCEAGVVYLDKRAGVFPNNFPCLGRGGIVCEKFEKPTLEQVEQSRADLLEWVGKIARGISPCCGAPLDMSRVIERGKHAGHGPRYCSNCKQFVMMV